jgi:hypothetical protein
MPETVAWSEPGNPANFNVAPPRVEGFIHLATIPAGWSWCWSPSMKLMAVHPDHRPREFDPATRKWSEFDGTAFVVMEPQPNPAAPPQPE